jgi:Flp pilus assembly protein TadG
MTMTHTLPRIARFTKSERGGITALSLFLLISMLMIGGYAVDVSNVMTARTKLQVTADAVAHAALLERELKSEDEAKTAALELAALNMPGEAFGNVITADEIVFGDWDAETFTFTPDQGSRQAVQVRTQRNTETGNPIRTHLLKLVGLDDWDVITSAVFVTYHPTCLREGFVAQQEVDLQSNNSYSNGFCIHSNSYVSLNSNNYFEPGTVVSMPDEDNIELPNSGFETNIGLAEALHEGGWNIRIIKRIDDIIAGLKAFDPKYTRTYVTSPSIVTLKSRTIYQADLVPGRLHTFSCGGGGGAALTFKNDVLISKIVLVTDCKIKFEAGVKIEDAVIATTSTSAQSMVSAAGLQVGRDDDCAVGGDAQLVTEGSMSFPSDLKLFNAQLLAKGDIEFSANASGIKGAALVAGGTISGTSNMEMAFCGTGMENNFHAEYFKLVM